ncbi:MAG: hypothetical protein ACRDQZ_12910, partial [Mycobacteriales bacterium]
FDEDNRDSGQVWLVGFRLDPDRDIDQEGADVYCLLLESRDEGPVTREGYTIFFKDVSRAGEALRMDDDETVRAMTPPSEVHYIYDLAEFSYAVTSEDGQVDSQDAIINCLNVVFDLVKATELPFPEDYKRVLYALADYMTFCSDLDQYLRENDVTRTQIRDGILWMIGVVVSRSKLI